MTTTSSADSSNAGGRHRPGDRSVAVGGDSAAPIVTGDNNQITTVQAPRSVAFPTPEEVQPSGRVMEIPRDPTRVFVGRDDQFRWLDRFMGELDAGGDVVISQAVHGLGGVGKSELALQYAYRQRVRYPVVWWVFADGPQSIEAGLAGLTRKLVPEAAREATAQEAARWAVDWLNAHPGWLLIFDNVTDPAHVEPWLARLTGGHMLITSRRDVRWPGTTATLRLDLLEPDAAVALLTQVSGHTDPAERGLAARIAEELGYLPLALDQAGAYIQQTRTPLDRYLRLLRDQPAQVYDAAADGDKSQTTIARQWDITLQALADTAPDSIALIQMLACFHPDDIPRALAYPAQKPNPVAIDRALGVLASHNMITLTDELISIHRLTQAVILHNTPGTQPRNTALGSLLNTLPPDPQHNIDGWPLWQSLLPHIDRIFCHYPADQQSADLGTLLNQTALFLQVQGQTRRAQQFLTKAVDIAEAFYGPDHPDVAIRLGNLAATYRALGQPAEAKPLEDRALAITEAVYGPDHPTVAIWLGNLAATYRALGQPAEAKPRFERALAITEAVYGPDHPDVAIWLGNLAATYRDLGQPAEAISAITQAEQCAVRTLGVEHPTTRSLHQFAEFLNDLDGVSDRPERD
ncbi:MAG TPA: tetratricopeptide repeat protein [Streptosporangiaceae bacterium]|nr:tetratricopeptide repeat protein [Streptosporangiaceae bacterium]